MKSYRIIGKFRTLSPLSHISEAISTVSYLVEEPVMQDDGGVESVFCYNGNAWRGQLRDLAAKHLLKIAGEKACLDTFHLIFSGGKIGGDQTLDISNARNIRRIAPMVALFGGGVGNQILPGKMRVGSSYPVCKEATRVLPEPYCLNKKLSYRDMTVEKSFTRKDDIKNPDLSEYSWEEPAKGKKDGEASTQMRMTSELLISGVDLIHVIDLIDVTDDQLGVFVAAINEFAKSPFIGGQSNRGHGHVSYDVLITDRQNNETFDFISVKHGEVELSDFAKSCLSSYLAAIEAVKLSGELSKFLEGKL